MNAEEVLWAQTLSITAWRGQTPAVAVPDTSWRGQTLAVAARVHLVEW